MKPEVDVMLTVQHDIARAHDEDISALRLIVGLACSAMTIGPKQSGALEGVAYFAARTAASGVHTYVRVVRAHFCTRSVRNIIVW